MKLQKAWSRRWNIGLDGLKEVETSLKFLPFSCFLYSSPYFSKLLAHSSPFAHLLPGKNFPYTQPNQAVSFACLTLILGLVVLASSNVCYYCNFPSSLKQSRIFSYFCWAISPADGCPRILTNPTPYWGRPQCIRASFFICTPISYLLNIFPSLPPFMLQSMKITRGWTLEQES